MTTQNRFQTWTFLVAFILVILFNLYMFKGLFHAFIFGGILAGTFYPFFMWSQARFRMNREWAAVLSTVVVVLAIIIPLIYIIVQISQETVTLYGNFREGLSRATVQNFLFGQGPGAIMLEKGLKFVGSEFTKQEVYQMLLAKVQSYSGVLLKMINSWLGDTLSFVLQFLMMILAVYGFFIEGAQLKRYVFELSPLRPAEEQLILTKFNQMNFVTMVGNGVGGVLQGGISGIVLWLCGIPNVFLWTTVMILLAFIPLVGISLVTVPAGIYLILTGNLAQGIILLAVTTIVAVVVENWFKPKFIGSRIKVNSIVLFFYIAAGMGTFGMAGIFYGPLLCVIFLTMGEIFLSNYLPSLSRIERS